MYHCYMSCRCIDDYCDMQLNLVIFVHHLEPYELMVCGRILLSRQAKYKGHSKEIVFHSCVNTKGLPLLCYV